MFANSAKQKRIRGLSIIEQHELKEEPWFQIGVPREISLEVLRRKEPGDFLVRESSTKPGCFALSLRAPPPAPKVVHYLILRTPRGFKIKVICAFRCVNYYYYSHMCVCELTRWTHKKTIYFIFLPFFYGLTRFGLVFFSHSWHSLRDIVSWTLSRDALRNLPHWKRSSHIIRWCLNNYRSHYHYPDRSICWRSVAISMITTRTSRLTNSIKWWFSNIRLSFRWIIVIRRNNRCGWCYWTTTATDSDLHSIGYEWNWNPYQIRN